MALTRTRLDLLKMVRDNYKDTGDIGVERRIVRAVENGLRAVSTRKAWEFLADTSFSVVGTPAVTSSVDTAAVGHGGTTVTVTALAPLASDIVGAFVEFNGEPGWYEITTRTNDSVFEIRDAYQNKSATALSTASYSILYPLVALPANYRKRIKMYDVLRSAYLAPAFASPLWYLTARRAGASQPTSYSVIRKRGDPNISQVLLYPAPSNVERYVLQYVRHAGWWSSATPATSTWSMYATGDTNYVDWPESKMDILEASIMAALYRETTDPKLASFVGLYETMIDEQQADDNENWSEGELGDSVYGRGFDDVRIDDSLLNE